MVLYSSPASPFARKVRMLIALEKLEAHFEVVHPQVLSPDPEYMEQVNPLGKIPALKLPSGRVLIESSLICQWIDSQFSCGHLSSSTDRLSDRGTVPEVEPEPSLNPNPNAELSPETELSLDQSPGQEVTPNPETEPEGGTRRGPDGDFNSHLPLDLDTAWQIRQRQALADGLMEAAVLMLWEKRKPPELFWPEWFTRQKGKVLSALTALEKNQAELIRERPRIDGLATLAAFDYLFFRHAEEHDWGSQAPELFSWLKEQREKPWMTSTQPRDATSASEQDKSSG